MTTEERKEYNKYMMEYMRQNRPLKICWRTIQNWRLHPKFFNEDTMFTLKEKKYIYRDIFENIKKNNELAKRAEEKYLKTL